MKRDGARVAELLREHELTRGVPNEPVGGFHSYPEKPAKNHWMTMLRVPVRPVLTRSSLQVSGRARYGQ